MGGEDLRKRLAGWAEVMDEAVAYVDEREPLDIAAAEIRLLLNSEDALAEGGQGLRTQDYARTMEELRLLREGAATCWRYLTGEVVEGLRSGRHTPEAAANIAEHQARNLLSAIERTGKLSPSGHATGQIHVPTPHRETVPNSNKENKPAGIENPVREAV